MTVQLALAGRAAREAFHTSNKDAFAVASERAEKLGRHFSVTIRDKYAAELDVQGSVITSGGVSLHDGKLPLRTLGTGSSRLIVSALQHSASGSHVALVDEIEHGLEPHRISRLLKYLRGARPRDGEQSTDGDSTASPPQVFMTSHSPVVIRELSARDIHAVRTHNGVTRVRSIEGTAKDSDTAQRHLRSMPEAFLARRVLVGEGKTECGLMRGLDARWTAHGRNSFAYQGVVAINGEGIPKALIIAKHLLELGYDVLALLDSDKPPSAESVEEVKMLGGEVLMWTDACATEQRIFLDVPWETIRRLLAYAVECDGAERILHTINAAMPEGMNKLSSTTLAPAHESDEMRVILGAAAKTDGKAWFKDIGRAECVADLIFNSLGKVAGSPLVLTLVQTRKWVDG